MPDRLQELAKQMAGSPANAPAPVQHSDADVDLWGHNETPQPIGQQALGMAKDFGKGVGESAVGLMSTGDEFARKHLPAFLTNSNMGFGPPADLKKVEQLATPVNNTQAVGAGLGDALGSMIPIERALPFAGKLGKMVSDVAEPVVNKVGELNRAWNPLPLRSRAVNALKIIADEAKDVPLSMEKTQPAIDAFRESVATGGRNAPVMTRLARRVENIPEEGPVNFPEARKFYTNVSRASAKPGFLRRALENPAAPDMRRNLGNVKEAMNADLTNAAEQVERGQDYTGALREYANNAKLRKLGFIGGAAAGAELARRTGLLGTIGSKVVGQ